MSIVNIAVLALSVVLVICWIFFCLLPKNGIPGRIIMPVIVTLLSALIVLGAVYAGMDRDDPVSVEPDSVSTHEPSHEPVSAEPTETPENLRDSRDSRDQKGDNNSQDEEDSDSEGDQSDD